MRRRELMSSTNGGGVVSHWWDNYMTIEALEDGLTVTNDDAMLLLRRNLEYSLDGKIWTRLMIEDYTPEINRGDVIAFRSDGLNYASANQGLGTFVISKKCNLIGNCMSLLYMDDAVNYDSVPDYAFNYLFYKCSSIISVADDFLPATIVGSYVYQNMFNSCSSLVKGPKLPATTIGKYCYYSMFYNCSSLTEAPALPATTLQIYCYYSMFYNCSSLTEAPALPATSLQNYCYTNMFRNCVKLKAAPVLPATTLAPYCYTKMFYMCYNLNYIKAMFTNFNANYTENWVSGVASTGTFVKNKNATWDVISAHGVPEGWTIKTE